MNKEHLITIVAGLFLGILAATGYFAASYYLPKLVKTPDKIVVQPPPEVIKPEEKNLLTLETPADNSSVTASPIVVSGKTVSGNLIVIFGNAEEKIASADATGSFSATLKLEEGENQISATVLGKSPVIVKRAVTLEVNP